MRWSPHSLMDPPASTRSPGQRLSEEQVTVEEVRLMETAVRLVVQPWLPKVTEPLAAAVTPSAMERVRSVTAGDAVTSSTVMVEPATLT